MKNVLNFLVTQKEELSEILNRQNNELFDNIFYKNIFVPFFFLEKMEAIIEKNSLVSDKIDIIELYSVGVKIHDVINQCHQNCACPQYLIDLKNLIDTIDTNHVPKNQMKIFEEILKNSNSFLLYDQIKSLAAKFL